MGNYRLVPIESPRLLPKLYTSGRNIKRSDSDEKVRLRGFVIQNPLAPNSTLRIENTLELMRIAKAWRANYINLLITTGLIRPLENVIRLLTEYAEQMAFYMMFMPSSKRGKYADIPYPDKETLEEISYLAKILRPYNHAFIGLWNEPAYDKTIKLLTPEKTIWQFVKDGVNAIRERNEEIIIALPGYCWSTDFRMWVLGNLKIRNAIYSVNDSPPWWDEDDPNDRKKTFDSTTTLIKANRKWEGLIKHDFPLIIQEFGSGQEGSEENKEQAIWSQKKINFYDLEGISYSFFIMSGYGWTRHMYSDMFDPDGELIQGAGPYPLSKRGMVAYNALRRNPGIQFDQ